jgi:hypothetical protein
MTITRSFYRLAALFLLGAPAWAGMASAQQTTASKADEPLPHGAVNTAHHQRPAKPTRPQDSHKPVLRKPSQSVAAQAWDKPGDKDSDDHYQPPQRNLMGQYQNAVTPPPVDGRR